MIGPLDGMDVRFNTPAQGLSVLNFNAGDFTFDAINSTPAHYELSYDQDWQRIIQHSDGEWADINEFMTSVERGVIQLYTYYASLDTDPEVVEGLLQIIWMIYDGSSVNKIKRFIDNGVLNTWSSLSLLMSYINTYSGTSLVISDNPDIYRLVFRDSDKASFDFFPKGIYIRGNQNIRYLGYSITRDPYSNEVTSASIKFDYAARNPLEVINEAVVTTHSTDVYGKPGRGYTIVEAHDPQTGVMEAMQMANPDLDYAFITHQFDTSLATENMFSVDQTHILKCTTRRFILLELQDEEWVERVSASRASVLGDDEEAMKYGVTSAVENIPMLWAVSSGVGSINITLYPLYDLAETDYFNNHVIRYKKTVNIPLVDATVNGFSSSRMGFVGTPPTSTYFVNTINITSSRAGNYVMIGMVYDKGVNQWTACIHTSISSQQKFVFNGYGCVGIEGTVTGSAVPMYAMNARSGISVSIRSKPDKDSGFKMNRAAYVSGQSLVFVDATFNRGICVSAKLKGARFQLKSLPLRFSRHEFTDASSSKRNDPTTKFKWVAIPNFGFVYFVASWAWAYSMVGFALNTWTTQHLLNEDDVFYEKEEEKKEEGEPPNDMWIKLGIALLMGVAERVGAAASAALQAYYDKSYGRINLKAKEGTVGEYAGDPDAPSPGEGDVDGYKAYVESATSDIFGKGSLAGRAEWNQNERIEATLSTLGKSSNKIVSTMVDLEKKSRPPGQLATQVLAEIRDRILAVVNSKSGGNVAAVAIAKARIGSSNLYSVGPNQNVWAGPGFTQVHFYQASRISGMWSTYKNAVGNGTLFVPRIPPIPIPYIGPVDINNDGAVGVHPITDFAPIIAPDGGMQANFNVGSKHMVYSYPIKDVQDHEIKQTQLAPLFSTEEEVLYESEYMTRKWHKPKLIYRQWDEVEEVTDNCSIVQGVDSYNSGDYTMDLPILVDSGYANFATPGQFDYCVCSPSELYYTATAGKVSGVSIRDTLVLDGAHSNVVVLNNMPLIASAYTCIETVRTLTKDTIRPRVVSGDILVFPMTGFNMIKGLEVLHGCDGYSNRISKLVGVTAVDGEVRNVVVSHIRQGSIKTGSVWPGVTYFGKFDMVPQMDTYLQPVDVYTTYLNNMGLNLENTGFRFSIPVVHKSLGLLPAAIQTLAPYKLNVIDGVTSLTTDLRTTESRNRALESHDFVIYGIPFRVGGEFIARLNTMTGTVALQDVVATLGLRYVGSTPQQAWFYTNITNGFYVFTMSNPTTGATSMESMGNAFRFKDVESGTWDFVSQEVAFKTLLDRDINERHDYYKDIVRVKEGFLGMVAPPNINTVWPKDGYFDLDSTAQGVAMRGRHRSQVNMFVWHDYMFREQITSENVMYGIPGYDRFNDRVNDGIHINHGLWDKLKGDKLIDFYGHRNYDWERYDRIYGYFIEEFKLCTSFIGLANNTDCMFEWEIVFALTPMMRRMLKDKYTTVYIAAETQSPGGGIYSPVTRLYMAEDLFGRTRIDGALATSETNTSYYTFRFNSRNGAGSMEKLYIWSDGPVAIKSPIDVLIAPITEQRTQPLVTRVDISELKEL
jgi:hypothetical protein